MLHTKIHGNRSNGSKKKIFMAIYHIWARNPSGHVINIILTYCPFLVPKSLNTKFCKKNDKWFLRKISFNLDMLMARDDIDLEYSHTFIYSSSCLHLPIFSSQRLQ